MSKEISSRTVRYRKRKQILIERKADLPPTMLAEDGDHLIKRTCENFPDERYFECVPTTSSTNTLSSLQLQEIETVYQSQVDHDNVNVQLQMEEVEVSQAEQSHCSNVDIQIQIPPVTTGEDNTSCTINPVSIKIAALASKHGLSNSAVNDILRFTAEVAYVYRDQIPQSIATVEADLFHNKLQALFLWKCPLCESVKTHSLYDNPFSKKCCGNQIDHNEDHYIIFDSGNVLQAILPIVYSHINLERYLPLRPRLFQQRESLNFGTDDISVTINLDGVSLTSGSKCVIHPILGFIDGTSSRCADQNILLFGFWLGRKGGKPDFNILLNPLVESFLQFENSGISWTKPDGSSCVSRVIISCCLCDSVERPLVQGMMQWNSEFGCSYCLHQEKGHYFTPEGTCSGLRSGQQYRAIIEQINRNNVIQNYGVRKPTPFLQLQYFDPIIDFPPCIMHAGYLGVCRTLIETWIQSRQCDQYYVSSNQIKLIDKYLESIKPPYRVSRKPRSLKFLAWYKAHELCMWLLYYSPPILHNILTQDYFHHWLLLLRGLSEVLRTETQEANLQAAANNLSKFWRETYNLYGKKTCHFNFHLLTHLPSLNQQLGPIYMFSMAPFETYNMRLKSFISSSQHVAEQITKRYIRDLHVKSHESNSPISQNSDRYSCHARKNWMPGWYKCPTDSCAVEYYGRIVRNTGIRFYSLCNTKCKVRNSCCFTLITGKIIEVDYFVRVPCSGNIYAVGSTFDVDIAFELWYYFLAKSKEQIMCNIEELDNIVLKIIYKGNTYFSKFINDVECYSE